jgi:Holliday junction resolvase RusA-like endonuclease
MGQMGNGSERQKDQAECSGTPLVCFIKLQAPSMNALHTIYCRGRIPKIELKGEVRLFKTQMMQMLPRWECPKEGWLNVSLRFHQPWHYLNGKVKRHDMPNLIKVVLDGIASRYHFDDSRVWQLCCEKSEAGPVGIAIGMSQKEAEQEHP